MDIVDFIFNNLKLNSLLFRFKINSLKKFKKINLLNR
jgi:hypothetical protein